MKKILVIAITLILTTSFISLHKISRTKPIYDSEYVEISTVHYKGEQYNVISMRREGNKIKAKYFATPDRLGKSVYNRYLDFKSKYKNIILVSSGTYMDQSLTTPEGLTIDNGIPVNETLIYGKMDALVIVQATGGVVVSNLVDGDLTLMDKCNNAPNRKFDIRNSTWDKDDFIEWAKCTEATVFQTHLLVYKNQLKISSFNSSNKSQERRFLAVGKEDGEVKHVIVHCPAHSTLYEGAFKAFGFLTNFKGMEVTFMINLDTGYQDVFELYNRDGSLNKTITGKEQLSRAVNLLTYYFQ
jgi:hypothetical protein